MTPQTTLPATLEVRYLPDTYTDTEVREGASWELGAGHYEIGANVDGAWFPLARLKGGGVQKKLAAAKRARDEKAAAQPADTEPGDSTSTA